MIATLPIAHKTKKQKNLKKNSKSLPKIFLFSEKWVTSIKLIEKKDPRRRRRRRFFYCFWGVFGLLPCCRRRSWLGRWFCFLLVFFAFVFGAQVVVWASHSGGAIWSQEIVSMAMFFLIFFLGHTHFQVLAMSWWTWSLCIFIPFSGPLSLQLQPFSWWTCSLVPLYPHFLAPKIFF